MHKFDPSHIERLLRQERFKELDPERLLREAGLKEGSTLADIGCGPGFFSFAAADVVGASGKVYAIDTQEEMLESLRKRNPPPQVAAIRSSENSIPLGDSVADIALVAYVLHETEDKPLFLAEVRRLLKPGGRALVIDWKKKAEEKGPPEAERLSEDDAEALLAGAGFTVSKTLSLNESHYSITAVKPRP